MSRIGKQIINIPSGTEVKSSEGVISVKGPKGTLERGFKPGIAINITDKEITLLPKKETIALRALWGTYASHIKNMVDGVNTPFEKKLIVEGVGFRSDVKGQDLVMSLGFSHPVEMKIPEELTVTAEKNVITVSGINKEQVGQFASQIRSKKKPEPYKGKGIRYEGEIIRRKEGKKSV